MAVKKTVLKKTAKDDVKVEIKRLLLVDVIIRILGTSSPFKISRNRLRARRRCVRISILFTTSSCGFGIGDSVG